MTTESCIFCGIVAGVLDASVVHESPTVARWGAHPARAELDEHAGAVRAALDEVP